MRTRFYGAVGVMLFAFGCGPGWRTVVGNKAVADLACDRNAVQIQAVGNDYAQASGCGRQNWYVKVSDTDWASPLDRATFEMACPKNQVTSTRLSSDTVGVSGCGKTAVYVRVVSLTGQNWVLNSAQTPKTE